ncbi:MAG: RidA family protein, partial [Alphaproteobacteria bacterium]
AQGPIWNGEPRYLGRIGAELSLEQGRAAAELTALNLVAQIKKACAGDLDRVRRIVRLGGFINAAPNFSQLPQVMDGASDLLVRIFDGAGRHARFVLGAAALPLGLAVAIDAVADVGGR